MPVALLPLDYRSIHRHLSPSLAELALVWNAPSSTPSKRNARTRADEIVTALPSSIMQEHSKQGKLSLVKLTPGTLRPLGLRKRSLNGRDASGLYAVRFKLAPPLKLHQSIFELLDIILPPKDHVPNNDRRRKVRDAAL
ncbi:MAG TPA: hypothetical protein PK050_08720, partial [Hyphomonadaceae bacterium]|nr:hypothetical protein [Hyphomonadaceae bacterium]